MNVAQLSQSPVLQRLRDFYAYVVQLKARAVDDANRLDVSDDDRPSADLVQEDLEKQLDSQLRLLESAPDQKMYQAFNDIRYVMVALADDVFINLEEAPALRDEWLRDPLEKRIFNTQKAGNEFFARLADLSPAQEPEVGTAYLVALLLGFRGEYRGRPDGDKEIESMTAQLFGALFPGQPVELAANSKKPLFPDAYANTDTTAPVLALPDPMKYLWMFVAAALVYCVASWGVWRLQTEDIRVAVQSSAATS